MYNSLQRCNNLQRSTIVYKGIQMSIMILKRSIIVYKGTPVYSLQVASAVFQDSLPFRQTLTCTMNAPKSSVHQAGSLATSAWLALPVVQADLLEQQTWGDFEGPVDV